MFSKFMPQMPANAVHTAKMLAQAARRLVTSLSSMVTIDRFTWIAVAMVSRTASIEPLMRPRWSPTSRKYSCELMQICGTRPPCILPAASSNGATARLSTMLRRFRS